MYFFQPKCLSLTPCESHFTKLNIYVGNKSNIQHETGTGRVKSTSHLASKQHVTYTLANALAEWAMMESHLAGLQQGCEGDKTLR